MSELNSTGSPPRAMRQKDQAVVVNEGGGSPDTIARIDGVVPTLGQVIATYSRSAM